MSDTAKAVLFTRTADGQTFTDEFTTDAGYEDPHLQCERTRAAVGEDFPDAIFAIGMNFAARQIMADRRMREMGLPVVAGEDNPVSRRRAEIRAEIFDSEDVIRVDRASEKLLSGEWKIR
jgi:hypothetical protein